MRKRPEEPAVREESAYPVVFVGKSARAERVHRSEVFFFLVFFPFFLIFLENHEVCPP